MKKEDLKPFTKRLCICRIKDDKTGKTKQFKETHTIYVKSKKEADEKFEEIKKKRRAEIMNTKEGRTLSEVIECYYKENTHFSISTVVKRQWYRKKIEEEFGEISIYRIEGQDIKDFLRSLQTEKKYAEETLRDFRRLLKDYFEYAEINKFIMENPMDELKKFEVGKRVNLRRNKNVLTIDDKKKVIQYIFRHENCRSFSLELKTQILLTLDGALRPTELYALTWDDIDLNEGYMNINKDITVISKKDSEEHNVPRITIGKTKTNGSVRKIPLSKRTVIMLTEYKAECEKLLKRKKWSNPNRILFFQHKGVGTKNEVTYAYGSGFRARLRKVSNYLLPDKKGNGVSPYELRKLSHTVRKNSGTIPPDAAEYVMGHNNNPLDLRYVHNYYPLVKKVMPFWEEIMDEIIGFKKSETKVRHFGSNV